MLPVHSTTAGGVIDPMEEFDRLRREMWSLLETPWGNTMPNLALGDLEETDDVFLLKVELPGMKKRDVDIELDGRRLVVTAERKERKRFGLLRPRQRHAAKFRQEVLLPVDVDKKGVRASFERGVLSIRLPKVESARRRRIPIG